MSMFRFLIIQFIQLVTVTRSNLDFMKVTMTKHGEMIMVNFSQIEHSITYLLKMHSRHWGIPEVLSWYQSRMERRIVNRHPLSPQIPCFNLPVALWVGRCQKLVRLLRTFTIRDISLTSELTQQELAQARGTLLGKSF